MIEKLKSFGMAAKTALLYILTPVGMVLIFIYYLFNKNKGLEQELKQAKADETIKDDLKEVKDAKKDADGKEADYNALHAQYERDKSSH